MDVIKELGISLHRGAIYMQCHGKTIDGMFVLAEDLRAAIEKLPVLYGNPDKLTWWGSECEKGDTHKARIIGVEKLVKEPLKIEKVIAYPKNFTCYAINGEELGSKLAGKKFKVVFEEVIE